MRYLRSDGTKEPNVRTQKSWIVIPVKPSEGSTPIVTETYLVQPRVADYIDLLESKIKGKLPKLPAKK